MPISHLNQHLVFPPPESAEDAAGGLLAVGGDLSRERLLLAYRMGIFPWYSPGEPILWWSPDPRLIIDLENLHIPRRLRREIRKRPFRLTLDCAFREVIQFCATVPRPGQHGTWITPEMIEAYIDLHETGFAHSVEAWQGAELVGGVYGVSLGRCFFGESMFSRATNASKITLVTLCLQLRAWDFWLLDCQVSNPHLIQFGPEEIPRADFLCLLEENEHFEDRTGQWNLEIDPAELVS
mgnify:CR=1 FL=1